MKLSTPLCAGLLALASITGAHATAVTVSEGAWQLFDVVDPVFGLGNNDLGWIDINDGSSLTFNFTIQAGRTGFLTVLDGGFAGDEFSIIVNGVALANTSAASNSYPDSLGLDFDAALTDVRFSRGTYAFGAGSYTVNGALSRSALDDTGAALNATVGALRLEIPEPSPLALLLAASGAMVLLGRRRS